jgi:hypothetical protein
MKMSRIGFPAGVALLLAAPALAQTAEPPAGTTPPAPAGAETQTGQTPPAPTDHAGHDKSKDGSWDKTGKPADKPADGDAKPTPQPQ